MKFIGGLKCLLLGSVLVLVSSTSSTAGGLLGCPVSLAWDASSEANVTGYALNYGLENSAATNRVDVGTARSFTLTNLYAYSNYFFFVVAYSASGTESVPSAHLFHSPPAIAKFRVSKLADGSTVLKFRSAVASPCRVEYSSTLHPNQWQTLAATNADLGGNVIVRDPPAGLLASRFYRAARP